MRIKSRRIDKFGKVIFPITVLACLSACIFLLAYSGRTDAPVVAQTSTELDSDDPPRNTRRINVSSKINDLQVVSSRIQDGRIILTVKNNFQKVINGFFLTVGNIEYQYELIYSDTQDGVSAFTEYDIAVRWDEKLNSSGLTVRAVLFEDGTEAGETKFAKRMLDKRKGEKLELSKGMRLLEEFISSGNARSNDDLVRLREKFVSLPSTTETTHNESVKLGSDGGRQRFLHYVEELSSNAAKSNPSNLDSDLRKTLEHLTKYVSKL